jgi:hypothetical protein
MAMLGAFSACLGAIFHSFQLIAAFRTGVANLGTYSTHLSVIVGITQHEIGGRLTNLGAIHHEPEMGGLDVFAACFQTVIHGGLQAHTVTVIAGIDTGLHVLAGGSKHKHSGLSFVGLIG